MEQINPTYQQWLANKKKMNAAYEYNSVLNLREYELSQATKPFRARGFKLQRCSRCLIASQLCVCKTVQPIYQPHRFVLIMYRGESIKPSNTGRLIAEILPNTLAFPWSRVSVEPELIAAINDTSYETYVVFPSRYQHLGQSVCTEVLLKERSRLKSTKKLQFIILDGTWSEAKKMFRKSDYLNSFPLLSIEQKAAHEYLLREASREEQLGTVSVALSILKAIDETQGFNNLLDYTDEFIRRYLSSKARNPLKLESIAQDIE